MADTTAPPPVSAGGTHSDPLSDPLSAPPVPPSDPLSNPDDVAQLTEISLDDAAETPSASPAKARPFSHASHVSRASRASHVSRGSNVSSVGFEEVGFDDDSSVWTEAAPGVVGSPARSLNASAAARESTPDLSRTPTRGASIGDGDTPLVLGVAVVDFNHLIGPTVEFSYPPSLQDALTADDDLNRILPFLALPDGAHLSEEDYSYFHCTYNPRPSADVHSDVPANRTLFGISCNRQIASSDLLRRSSDVTRSMVQKAIIVLSSQPLFGPVRDRLGVVTRAFFAQRDFESTQILEDFYMSLEASLEGKAGESAIYMGTSLRELVHKFRHRTLVLLKLLLLQRRVMLFGYPVEKLCTYQYSLLSLIPGLLMALRDAGSPALDYRKQRVRPTSLRTSDRASLLRYMGLPLHLFGADAFFQPYLPLQQMDQLQARSWLVGTTNQIVTQQKDCKYDVLVNIDQNTFEFADPKVERLVNLTSADRKWMDDIVKVVDETWNLGEGERPGFQGSDDDLRARFEEYICAFLASLKYADYMAQNKAKDTMTGAGVSVEPNPLINFSEPYAAAFRGTPAYEIWDACTDPVIFDLNEPRHPCSGQVNTVSDIGIRLAEGFHDLKIEESLAPTREAISSAFATGSSSLFRAFDSVRSEVNHRLEAERHRRAMQQRDSTPSSDGSRTPTTSSTPPHAGTSLLTPGKAKPASIRSESSTTGMSDHSPAAGAGGAGAAAPMDVRAALGTFGSNVGSFFGSRIASFQRPSAPPPPARRSSGMRPLSLAATPNTTSAAALLGKK